MALKEEVERFLKDFRSLASKGDLLFMGDSGISRTAKTLGITFKTQAIVLGELNPEDYSRGPVPSIDNMWDEIWVFGTEIFEKSVLVELTIGGLQTKALCLSFEISDHKINYPLKRKAS